RRVHVGPLGRRQLVEQLRRPSPAAPDIVLGATDEPEPDLLDHAARCRVVDEASRRDLVETDRLESTSYRRGRGFGHQALVPHLRREPIAELAAIETEGPQLPDDVVEPDTADEFALVLDRPTDAAVLHE